MWVTPIHFFAFRRSQFTRSQFWGFQFWGCRAGGFHVRWGPVFAFLLSIAGGLLSITGGAVHAHPHVAVQAKSELEFTAKGHVRAVRHAWEFDEAFSAYAVQGLDSDGDGGFSLEELQPLAEVNVTSLAEYDFFTFLTLGGEAMTFTAPEDYFLILNGNKLTLYFALPLTEPADIAGDRLVTLDVFDPEYFVNFSFVDDGAPVTLVDAPAACSVEIDWAEELDPMTETMLAAIGVSEEVPPELLAETAKLANTAKVTCP